MQSQAQIKAQVENFLWQRLQEGHEARSTSNRRLWLFELSPRDGGYPLRLETSLRDGAGAMLNSYYEG